MLTAKSEEIDKVVGLEMGADDYITKPFGVRELIARVKSVLRRTQQLAPAAEVLEAGEVKLNKASHTVEVRGKIVKMAPREFDLLALLMSNPGRALSRNVILDRVWGEDAFCEPHTVDVHIRWLREKIEKNPSKPTYIVTVRGVGYRFEKEPKSR
jgi:DNA-binding response OmpR family regulator